jgi:hypothetical protein
MFTIKKYDTFQISGRGTVFALSRKENGLKDQDINLGDLLIADDVLYSIRGIERFAMNTPNRHDKLGLLVKKVYTES